MKFLLLFSPRFTVFMFHFETRFQHLFLSKDECVFCAVVNRSQKQRHFALHIIAKSVNTAFCISFETVAIALLSVQPSDKYCWDSSEEKSILAGADDLDLICHYSWNTTEVTVTSARRQYRICSTCFKNLQPHCVVCAKNV